MPIIKYKENNSTLIFNINIYVPCYIQIEIVRTEQANTDFSIFCELLKDYIGLIGAVKVLIFFFYFNCFNANFNYFFIYCIQNVFHERVKVYQNMQHAQMILTKKREQKTKYELTGRLDKIGAVTNEVTEVKQLNIL